MTDIHSHLKALRRARELTQEAVARQMGLTRQAVSSHESGRTQPDLETLARYGEVYGVSLQEILYGGSPRPQDSSLLGSEEMKTLIKLVRDMADYVILDTAPAELLVDASLMARYADAALYVIRYDYTKMNKIRGGVEALALRKVDIIGYIFNGDMIDLADLEQLSEADGLYSALDHPPVLAVFVERLTELFPCQIHALADLAQLCGDLRQARIGNFSACPIPILLHCIQAHPF